MRKFIGDVFDDDDDAALAAAMGRRSFSQPPLPPSEAPKRRNRSETMCKFVRSVFDDDGAGITPSVSESDLFSEDMTTRKRGNSCTAMTDEGVDEMCRWADGVFGMTEDEMKGHQQQHQQEAEALKAARVGSNNSQVPHSADSSMSGSMSLSSAGCDAEMKKQIADTLALVKAARKEKKIRKEQEMRSN